MHGIMTVLFQVRGRTEAQAGSQDADHLRLMVPTLPASELPAHRHAEAHFILVLRGHYRSAAAGCPKEGSREPCLIFNPPRTEHQDCFDPSQVLPEARFLSLSLSARSWLELCVDAELPLAPQALYGPAAEAVVAALMPLLRQPHTSPLDFQCALTRAAEPFARSSAAMLDRAPPWLRRLKAQLRAAALDEPGELSLAMLARELDLHPVYLSRAFRRHLGESPAAYVRALRLDKAAHLIRHTRRSLAEVAADSGFFDQAHLAHSFRAAYGLSPSAYRRLA